MIIARISDGLGNQMFQYACGYAQSKRLHSDLVLDATILDNHKTRCYELYRFGISNRIQRYKHLRFVPLIKIAYIINKIANQKVSKKFIDQNPYVYNEQINEISDNTYLSGYWQSERYFSEYRNDLLKIFQYNSFSDGARMWLSRVQECNSVAIHVRRGDYVAGNICIPEKYYHQAISVILEKVGNPIFFVFSDDMNYAINLLKRCGVQDCFAVKYETDNATIEDMMLMSHCKHNIIANSSFSWWGAWLNPNTSKVVICPEYKQWTGDFYPDNWVKIKCDI